MDEVIKRLRTRQNNFGDSDGYQYSCNGGFYTNYDDCYSNWYSWGRWIFIAAIIIAFLMLFALCACLTRRRRRRGLQPYYGTAWMPFRPADPNNGHQFQQYPPQQYDPNNPQSHGYTQYYAPPTAPAPPYTPSPQMGGTHFQPTSPQPQQTGGYYPPPPGSPPNQYGMTGVNRDNTGATRESDYYMPPPGPPPAAHVGKI